MRVNPMTTNEFQVTGMSCGHCESAVRGEVAKVAGVEQVDVSAASGRLLISASAPLDDAAVLAAVAEAGYEAARV
jgi:copper chaperone